MPDYVCLLRPAFDSRFMAGASPEQRAVVERHGTYLLGLAEQGRLVLAGRCWDGPVGIVIVSAEDEEAARAVFAADPSLVAGLQSAEIYPFSIFAGRERESGAGAPG